MRITSMQGILKTFLAIHSTKTKHKISNTGRQAIQNSKLLVNSLHTTNALTSILIHLSGAFSRACSTEGGPSN